MFIAGIALIIYGLYVMFAATGIALIVSGTLSKRRRGGGTAQIVIGAAVALLPVAVIASSYLPGQH